MNYHSFDFLNAIVAILWLILVYWGISAVGVKNMSGKRKLEWMGVVPPRIGAILIAVYRMPTFSQFWNFAMAWLFSKRSLRIAAPFSRRSIAFAVWARRHPGRNGAAGQP